MKHRFFQCTCQEKIRFNPQQIANNISSLRVVVAARDLAPGDQTKIGKTIVAIQVEDENDNPPSIEIDLIVESNGSAGRLFYS